jgi:hypothetical protein
LRLAYDNLVPDGETIAGTEVAVRAIFS